ncbi:hypothetical protein BCR32DRAFT_280675 [Anaeromyces robustus]|uniref:Uncharacterized protein n=1 Tax=Anaeromyces robustus TaxID=1754192 RepID=A0A1Y1X3B3_9FUNG|nr:hypothetical protein BCR32DRAFT_280675 [Anaeromyces robustus]|eukprot:ORX80263.1 hypothetical protein BCR32DRAFT_280675 [Anaeromyces robustus]
MANSICSFYYFRMIYFQNCRDEKLLKCLSETFTNINLMKYESYIGVPLAIPYQSEKCSNLNKYYTNITTYFEYDIKNFYKLNFVINCLRNKDKDYSTCLNNKETTSKKDRKTLT